MPKIRRIADRPGRTCPLCREVLGHELADPHWSCLGCETVYHWDCARELGGCATAGCTRRGERPSSLVTPPARTGRTAAAKLGAEEETSSPSRWRRGLAWGGGTLTGLLLVGGGLGLGMAHLSGQTFGWDIVRGVLSIAIPTASLVGIAAALGAE